MIVGENKNRSLQYLHFVLVHIITRFQLFARVKRIPPQKPDEKVGIKNLLSDIFEVLCKNNFKKYDRLIFCYKNIRD